MEQLEQIIKSAETGNHPACKTCSRNPERNNTAFASNCDEHYGTNRNGLVIIARDPGKRGASKTAKLCPDCNNDRTATVSKKYYSCFNFPRQSIYFLNAILHGYFDANSKAKNDAERKCCKVILEEIISCLQPKAILALGMEALQSSLEILEKTEVIKPTILELIDRDFSYGQISGVSLFAFPHPAYARVNLGNNNLKETDEWAKVATEINIIMAN